MTGAAGAPGAGCGVKDLEGLCCGSQSAVGMGEGGLVKLDPSTAAKCATSKIGKRSTPLGRKRDETFVREYVAKPLLFRRCVRPQSIFAQDLSVFTFELILFYNVENCKIFDC